MTDFNQNWPDLRVGDVVYLLGSHQVTERELRTIEKASWFQAFAGETTRIFGKISVPGVFYTLCDRYMEHCHQKGCEPAWMEHLAHGLRQQLRTRWMQSEYFDDPLAIVAYQSSLNFSFAVVQDGMIHKVCAALNVFRLEEIKQLSFLHDPVMNEITGERGLGLSFEHNRYVHSLTVMAVATLMGIRSGLSLDELRHLQVAALTHDVLTPAGGDAVKYLDSDAFDEDLHYSDVFLRNAEWKEIRDCYGLSEELLSSIVRGEGKLGKLLDLADKSAYVAHDMDAYLMENDPRTFKAFISPESLMTIWHLQKYAKRPLCDLWAYVEVVGDQVVLRDSKGFARFAKLRALMFKHLYYNPKARYREQMLATLIIDCLYQERSITRKELLSVNDHQLNRLVDKVSGTGGFQWALSRSDVAPRIESFADTHNAKERWRVLLEDDPTLLVMMETFPPVSEKIVEFLVRDKKEAIRPLRKVLPSKAEEILELGRDPCPVKLYILALRETETLLSPSLREKLVRRQFERLR